MASWVKKFGEAGSYNFSIDSCKFATTKLFKSIKDFEFDF